MTDRDEGRTEWTDEQWADALDAARDDMMTLEDWEPSDVAHVMTIAAARLRAEPSGDVGEEAVLDERFVDQLRKLEESGYTLTKRAHVEELARLRRTPGEREALRSRIHDAIRNHTERFEVHAAGELYDAVDRAIATQDPNAGGSE